MTYKSKNQIDKKLAQVKHIHRDIDKFKNRILTNNGVDPETGVHPLIIYSSSFLSSARSIIQYAYKEAKEVSKLAVYKAYVSDIEIFKIFKEIRDIDIHEYTIGVHGFINVNATNPIKEVAPAIVQSEPVTIVVDSLDDLNTAGEQHGGVKVSYTLSKLLPIDDELIDRFTKEGRQDLLTAIANGKELYGALECENTTDLHQLCDLYIAELEKFIQFGLENGFVS